MSQQSGRMSTASHHCKWDAISIEWFSYYHPYVVYKASWKYYAILERCIFFIYTSNFSQQGKVTKCRIKWGMLAIENNYEMNMMKSLVVQFIAYQLLILSNRVIRFVSFCTLYCHINLDSITYGKRHDWSNFRFFPKGA